MATNREKHARLKLHPEFSMSCYRDDAMPALKPFQNEEDSMSIGELTIENRLDRISLYGSLSITRDKAGFALAKELKTLLDATVAALKAEQLPEHVATVPVEKVKNPFSE